ncbi:ribonuclease Z [Clostridium ganghwense]|uniref:Ribonuclease Z n=1 Tax=Clostridium ganghwense TaxID=312089 RepID=A0ABT4CNZ0_9CLOT|nr:ribonuclease Z [Clostridium ganghwense]MCY6370775.1 ribonuclease Z [Clostridium ganghwense]
MIRVCLLASGGMMPMPNRYLSSMLVSCKGSLLLVDCGEGTQILLKKLKWGIKAIDVICITHYHADHTAGLPGLLSTIGNSGRTEPITIIGPKGLKEIIKGLTVITPELPFKLNLIEVSDEGLKDYKDKEYYIGAVPVEHSLECMAYSIEVKRNRKFDKNKAESKNIPREFWRILQKGETVQCEDKMFTPEMILGKERKGIKVSYCTDTRPVDKLIDFIRQSDLFIGEGMYGDDDYLEKAKENYHMLFSECAYLAKEADVKELWLTHFSPSIKDPEEFLYKAEEIFPNSKIGEELMIKELNFEKD